MYGISPITPQNAFGQVLRRHRLKTGWSQEQLGLESGVQRNFISLIETGQNQPTITTLFRLAAALGKPSSVLIAEVEELLVATPENRGIKDQTGEQTGERNLL